MRFYISSVIPTDRFLHSESSRSLFPGVQFPNHATRLLLSFTLESHGHDPSVEFVFQLVLSWLFTFFRSFHVAGVF